MTYSVVQVACWSGPVEGAAHTHMSFGESEIDLFCRFWYDDGLAAEV